MTNKTIIGIDPGTNILGFGVIRINGKPEIIDFGILDLRKETNVYIKLKKIYTEISRLCDVHKPDEMALESPFMDKNAQVILKLGRAQGAAILAATVKGINITEYAPRKAKIAITGSGSASKEQVATVMERIFNIKFNEKFTDSTDALAIALCHYYSLQGISSISKSSSSWEQFISNNPDRIK